MHKLFSPVDTHTAVIKRPIGVVVVFKPLQQRIEMRLISALLRFPKIF